MSGTLYPWTVAELVPGHLHNVNLELGDTPAWTTGAMFPLGVEAEFLQRDTAMFGPNFSLPVYLDSRDIGFAKILAYQKSAASATFTPLAAGDTVRIAGAVLQRRDTILLLLTPTAPVAPYTTTRAVRFVTDLRVPEGDWYISTLANLNDGITFTCSKPGDSVSMNATDNVKSVLTFLSGAGTWKKTASGTLKSVTHTWSATPAYADTLRKYNVTLTSTLVTGTRGDTIKLHTDLRFNLASALRGDSGAVPPPAYGWWWLVPAGALTLALRRRTRRMALFASGISLLVLVGCEIGQISFLMDESFDFTFTKMRFTADPARPADPLMQVTAGAGRTVMNSFRSEYWDYTTNVSGGRDSTRVTCTGAGTATYAVDATAFTDGTAPPASNLMESLAGLLRTTPDELRARMNRR